MPVHSFTEFLEGLASSQLLENHQIEEVLRRPETPAADLSAVGRFLQDRGWLTRFQVQEIRAGRATSLTFGGYRILEQLETSPAGQWFRAYHPALQRVVLLGWLRSDWLQPADNLPSYLKRAQAASLVSHTNLVNILDAGVMNDTPFIVQDDVDGADLGYFVAAMGPLPTPLACEYIAQAASALAVAHEKGVAHGDLQPVRLILAPVLRSPSESRPGEIVVRPAPTARVHVKGMGLTPLRPPVGELTLADAERLGAVDYLAPERITNGELTTAGDLFSLGGCFYFLLGGRPPFGGGHTVNTLLQIRQGTFAPIESLRPDLPAAVADLVRRLLSQNPNDRPGAAEVVRALIPFGLRVKPTPPSPLAPLASETSTRPVPVPLASETMTRPSAPPAMLQQDQNADAVPTTRPLQPMIEPLSDHHGPNSHPAGEVVPGALWGTEEQHDPFAQHPDDLPPSSGVMRRRAAKRETASNKWVWIAVGAVLHLTAALLLIGWFLGWFSSSPSSDPGTAEPEQHSTPKKKKRTGAAPMQFNWAQLDIHGADTTSA
jgi:eukaryotic-like serine/threonine-protein kinase